jgi:hypothetical protein
MSQKSRPGQQNNYGFASPISEQFPSPIIAQRVPNTADTGYAIGQIWVDQPNDDAFILTTVAGGAANWINIGGGTGQVSLLTGDTGFTAPVAGNINVFGGGTISTSGVGNTLTVTTGTGGFPITPFVVGPSGQAGYLTVQSAITACFAAGGGNVFVQPGLYIENLTLQPGVCIFGANNDPSGSLTEIAGVHTPPVSGVTGFQNISLQSNSDLLNSAIPGACSIFITHCDIDINGFIYNLPSWDSTTLYLSNCTGNTSADNSIINAGGTTLVFYIDDCYFRTGTTGAQFSGFLKINNSTIFSDWTFNSTGNAVILNSYNSGVMTFLNSSQLISSNSTFFDSVNPIVQNSAGTLEFTNCVLDGGINPISGAGGGIVTLGGVTFPTTIDIPANLILGNTAATYSDAGFITTNPSYAFFVYLNAPVANATGDGTSYILGTDPLAIVYNFDNVVTTGGIFTAPRDGIYNLSAQASIINTTIATDFNLSIIATNGSIENFNQRTASSNDQTMQCNASFKMVKGDVAAVAITVLGEAAATDSIDGGASPFVTWFQGNMVV